MPPTPGDLRLKDSDTISETENSVLNDAANTRSAHFCSRRKLVGIASQPYRGSWSPCHAMSIRAPRPFGRVRVTELERYAEKHKLALIRAGWSSASFPSDSSSRHGADGNHLKVEDDAAKKWQGNSQEEYHNEWDNDDDDDDNVHHIKPERINAVYNWDRRPVVCMCTSFRVWDWDANEEEDNTPKPLTPDYSPVSSMVWYS